MGTLSGVLAAAWLSMIFGSLVVLQVIVKIIRLGPGRYFTTKDRTGKNRPKVLDNYGTHQFIQLPKQGIKMHYVSAGSEDRQLMLFVHG